MVRAGMFVVRKTCGCVFFIVLGMMLDLICSDPPAGDLNEDDKVDMYDYVILAANWHK